MNDDLRADLMKWLSLRVGGLCWDEAPWQEWGNEADDLLALPALQRLVEQAAEAARLRVMLVRVLDQGADCREAVGRVRDLADEIEADAARSAPAAGLTPGEYARAWRADAPRRIRRALDGTDA